MEKIPLQIRLIDLADMASIQAYCNDSHIEQFLRYREDEETQVFALINSNNYLWYVATLADNIVGDIIAELKDMQVAISIRIANCHRGNNFGAELLNLTLQQLTLIGWQYNSIFAGIDKENTSSLRLFTKLGFTHIGEDKNGILQYVKQL